MRFPKLFTRASPEPTTPAYDTYYDQFATGANVAGVNVNRSK